MIGYYVSINIVEEELLNANELIIENIKSIYDHNLKAIENTAFTIGRSNPVINICKQSIISQEKKQNTLKV